MIYEEIREAREADFRFAKPPYAALWKSSSRRIQLVSGFLGKIWVLDKSYWLVITYR
jgi:hypothetical protein